MPVFTKMKTPFYDVVMLPAGNGFTTVMEIPTYLLLKLTDLISITTKIRQWKKDLV